MKHLFIALLLVAGLVGCTKPQKSLKQRLDELERPIILLAETKDGGVILQDSKGKWFEFESSYLLAQAISNTYDRNDTITILNKP